MVEFGKKIYPPKKKAGLEKTATSVKGSTWSIELGEDGYLYKYLSGGHGGGVKTHIVAEQDFADIHAERMTIYELMLKYDLN